MRALGAVRTSGEGEIKKKMINGVTHDVAIDAGIAILKQRTPSTSPTWFDHGETICDVKTLSPHDTSRYFSIADTDSNGP